MPSQEAVFTLPLCSGSEEEEALNRFLFLARSSRYSVNSSLQETWPCGRCSPSTIMLAHDA